MIADTHACQTTTPGLRCAHAELQRARWAEADEALQTARAAWRMAVSRERVHTDKCRLNWLGRRCGSCLTFEAETNVAADRVEQARRRAQG